MISRDGPLGRSVRLLISVAFFAYASTLRATGRLMGRDKSAICVVLYYHSIPAKHRQAFARQLETLKRVSRPVNLSGVLELTPGARYAAITFDDGFEDILDNAIPELVIRRIPATVFVTTGAMGELATWWPATLPERGRRIATAKQLQQLPSEWIGIGAHTITHPRLSELGESAAKREILEPRRELETLLGRTIDTFSFPYGDFNEKLILYCREAGYKRIFTSQAGNAFQEVGEFAIGRVKAEPTDWDLEFQLKLRGGYLWLPWASALKRKLRGLVSFSRKQ